MLSVLRRLGRVASLLPSLYSGEAEEVLPTNSQTGRGGELVREETVGSVTRNRSTREDAGQGYQAERFGSEDVPGDVIKFVKIVR